ncbi:hypothetical protein LTR84_004350 [Exophiala bonariae]|uniref:Uncharacterized protein n=1 Tax=Exophiala bonariae TaxID=1690606 RepID=A0AAV9N7W1_9EURO|nr:hypothetical protein LTR84_004350 [Exophiala bonariae]
MSNIDVQPMVDKARDLSQRAEIEARDGNPDHRNTQLIKECRAMVQEFIEAEEKIKNELNELQETPPDENSHGRGGAGDKLRKLDSKLNNLKEAHRSLERNMGGLYRR